MILTWMVVALAVWLAPGAHASVLVSPARLELEVGEGGHEESVTFVNKGAAPVQLRLYSGFGGHAANGAPLYFDDPESREVSARWVQFESDELRLDPGEVKHVSVHFASPPSPGAVAAYPVLFAEMVPIDASEHGMEALRSVARVAIPTLVTFTTTRFARTLDFRIDDFRVRTLAGEASVHLDVQVFNEGNVHGMVEGVVHAFDAEGHLLSSQPLPSARVLPGAARTLSLRWDTFALPPLVRFVADLDSRGDGSLTPGAPIRMALTVSWDVEEGEVNITHVALEPLPQPSRVSHVSFLVASE